MNDLSNFELKQDELTIEIKNPSDRETVLTNEDGSPMTITVWLPHSAEAKAIDYEFMDRLLASRDKKEKRNAAKIDAERLERLAKTTKAWNITLDKKKPTLTVETAIDVYKRLNWLYAQIVVEIEEAVSFTKD